MVPEDVAFSADEVRSIPIHFVLISQYEKSSIFRRGCRITMKMLFTYGKQEKDENYNSNSIAYSIPMHRPCS